MGPEVHADPLRGGRLQRLDLAGDAPVRGPPLLDQRGVRIRAGEPDRGQVQVQPGGSATAGNRRRGQHQLPADPLRDWGQRLERPAQPVVIEQIAGTPSSSATAAQDAHPATS